MRNFSRPARELKTRVAAVVYEAKVEAVIYLYHLRLGLSVQAKVSVCSRLFANKT
jgi:hypothetical protein